jgi:hypothetical protein
MDQAAPTNQVIYRHVGQCSKEPDMGFPVRLPFGGNHEKEGGHSVFALHFSTDSRGQLVREKAHFIAGCGGSQAKFRHSSMQPAELIQLLTG